MRIRVQVILESDQKSTPLHVEEVASFERGLLSPETLGLRLGEAKQMLADLEGSGAHAPDLAAAFQRVVRLQLRAGRMNWYRGMRAMPLDSFAIRLGDTAIIAIASEPYSRIGVDVKTSSPFRGKTLFAGYVGGDMMYLPTAEAFADHPPSMQVDNSPYTPEAAKIATAHMIELLNRI